MKKLITAVIILSMLTLQACSNKADDTPDADTPDTIENTPDTDPDTNPADKETETESDSPKPPQTPEIINYTTLELEKDPVFDNGIIVLYFTDHEIWYSADTEISIGVIASGEAYTISGTADMTAYPDMKIDDDNYCGIAVKPEEAITPGSYKISMIFSEYKVNFSLDIE